MECVDREPWAVDREPHGDVPRSTVHGPRSTMHLFGLTQISMLHAKTLRWLGQFFDLHVYHFNVLADGISRQDEEASTASAPAPGGELLRFWGRAGAESLHTLSQLCAEPCVFSTEVVAKTEPHRDGLPLFEARKPDTVLARLQQCSSEPEA